MREANKSLEEIQKHKVLSFDVFDTLLIRDIIAPVDVFRYTYGAIGRYFRSLSYLIARRRSKTKEVELNAIRQIIPFLPYEKEIEFEKNICRANPELYDLYREFKKQGKKIYAISDMYLSSDVLSEILKNAGYSIPVYVSCEHGCSKKDGKLFRKFLEEYHLDPSQVLHIGDNKEADYQGARAAGIESILIERHKNAISYIPYNRKTYELAGFINHGLNVIEDSAIKIGYEVLGPMILSFCQWIHQKQKENGFERLFFLARDMHFIYDIYRGIYPDDARYLFVSRKSLRNARLDPEEFCLYLEHGGCFGNSAIVDIGWVGIAQNEIENAAKQIQDDTDLGGLYWGTKLAYRKKKRSKRSFSCFYSSFFEQFRAALIPPFLESMIGTNEKQVVSYEDGAPVFDTKEHYNRTNAIKTGARQFVTDWIRWKGNKAIPPRIAKKAFQKLFYHPKPEHIAVLANLHFEDVKDTRILSYQEGYPYWKNPKQWLSDLQDSAWKGAFFRKSGFVGIALSPFYYFFNSIRIHLLDMNRCRKNEI